MGGTWVNSNGKSIARLSLYTRNEKSESEGWELRCTVEIKSAIASPRVRTSMVPWRMTLCMPTNRGSDLKYSSWAFNLPHCACFCVLQFEGMDERKKSLKSGR